MKKIIVLSLIFSCLSYLVVALPSLTDGNVDPRGSRIKVWNVKATSDQREGSTTATEGSFRVQRPTVYQDGEICHNYGSSCWCGTTTYYITPSIQSKWYFNVPSNKEKVSCPAGISPTGDKDIREATSREESMKKIDAIREMKRGR
ncbi:MAG: hypothetical protein HY541_03550 [Deltaproteobacteria bacterium]|nr:hypothetical protein [Deltaproteobacteria bacterium]